MVAPAPGPVVVVRFPFSDLSQTKLRPAVVLAGAGRGDWILCQVTGKPCGDVRAINLEDTSYARPGKLFTASRDLILAQVGRLKPEPCRQIIDSVVSLLSAGASQ